MNESRLIAQENDVLANLEGVEWQWRFVFGPMDGASGYVREKDAVDARIRPSRMPIGVLPTDNHLAHIQEHATILDLGCPFSTSAACAHIEEHFAVMLEVWR